MAQTNLSNGWRTIISLLISICRARRRCAIGVCLGLLGLLGLPAAAWANGGAFILDSIQGAKTITIRRTFVNPAGKTDQKSVELKAGAKLQSDDLLQTGPSVSARVIYPDGSIAVIGRSSKFYVVHLPSRQSSNDVQGGELVHGQIRFVVRKSGMMNMRKRYRFVVKTRAAVLGVRGTDFVVASPVDQRFELHAISGQVDVGLDPKRLRKAEGRPGVDFVTVDRNQFVTVTQGQATLPAPQSYNPDQYLQQLSIQQPDMNLLLEKPLPEAFSEPLNSAPSSAGPGAAGKSSGNYYLKKVQDAQKLQEQRIDRAVGQ
ncbi:MAG: hypothetical protein A2Z97_09900 [Bdellovibrionales bacterium GWB1_52_6]|nr:MAG: hypothetical protein A2Z97_09900 [Bdellovibrionales bacterium GWB1_52_6]OFZ05235.1 MAG: hypothetical protein A2X97_10615 [Bdellovibrionales bacterium GWA1_52_35]HCM38632.1 hypothetical protein [Bdellovibrionales bacterium]